jgi:hypothetical protein
MSTSRQRPEPSKHLSASKVKRKKVTWLWQERIPEGMLSLIAGRPGQGKSLLAAYLAADITKNGGDVIFSNREDPLPQVVRPRLEAAGARLNRVHFFGFTLPDDLVALEGVINTTKAKAVIIDPVAAHLTPSMYNDQDVRTALSPVAEMAVRTNCAIIMITHTVKYVSQKAHPLTAIGGSGGGLTGAARAIFLFGIDPADKDQRALVPVKNNLGPEPMAITFEMDEIDFQDADGNLEATAGRLVFVSDQEKINPLRVLAGDPEVGSSKSAERREAAAEWLTIYLSLGKRPVNELKEDAIQLGMSWSTIRRASEDVGVENFRVGGGKGSYSVWQLPDGHPALVSDDDNNQGTIEGLLGGSDA